METTGSDFLSPVSVADDAEIKLSKNELKRRKKAEMWELKKQQKKELKKQTKKQAHHSIGNSDPSNLTAIESFSTISQGTRLHCNCDTVVVSSVDKLSRREKAREELIKQSDGRFSVIIDCSFEDNHSEKTLKSLCQQISFCYGLNRHHSHPVRLYFTGLGTKTTSQLSKSKAENWIGVTLSSDCYTTNQRNFSVLRPEIAALQNGSASSGLYGDLNSTGESKMRDIEEFANFQQSPKQLVYLTSDAEETLETLDDSCAYVIGGIVDRNSLKGATFRKAQQQGLRTAKLPIRENVALASTHVLTVNHVFEILLCYSESKSWKTALQRVVPQRKVATTGVATKLVDTEQGEADSDAEDDVEDDGGDKQDAPDQGSGGGNDEGEIQSIALGGEGGQSNGRNQGFSDRVGNAVLDGSSGSSVVAGSEGESSSKRQRVGSS